MESEIKQPKAHIFSRRFSRNKVLELSITGVLRLFTYLVIILAGYLFCDIAYNGSKVLFTKEAPFINVQFLTEKPQTLHVFEPADIDSQLKAARAKILTKSIQRKALSSSNLVEANNYTVAIKELNKEIKQLDLLRKERRLMFSDT